VDAVSLDVGAINGMVPADAARAYGVAGLRAVPLKHATKKPPPDGWQQEVRDGGFLPEAFSESANVALALGAVSRGVVDVDIDCDDPRAVEFADDFLPPTVTFGRDGRPRSHRLYVALGEVPQRDDVWIARKPKAEHVEIRAAGHYTVCPPSRHPSGALVRFESDLNLVQPIDGSALRGAVGKIVAGVILVRVWPERGARHDFRLALVGALLNAQWSREDVLGFLTVVAAHVADDVEDLRDVVASSATRRDRTGWPRLAELIGIGPAKLLREALLPRSQGQSREPAATYFDEEGVGTFRRKATQHGEVSERLANFSARIAANVSHDDGAEVKQHYEMRAQCGKRHGSCSVPVEKFAQMQWVGECLGSQGIIAAGTAIKDHLRAAIQELSLGTTVERRVYRHTGWREIDGRWIYLHGDGAIGADGPVDGIDVELPPQLEPFRLPWVESEHDRKAAARAAWDLCSQLQNSSVTLPVQAVVWRSVLPLPCLFSAFLVGPTGVFKSQLAALAQQHFGAGFTHDKLPANWSSTANALEGLAFTTKDALLVADDFAPRGSQLDVQRYHQTADRLFRAQGNHAGRARMTTDANLRVSKAPRGVTLATGEDVPDGHSVRARMLLLEMTRDSIASDGLTAAQDVAAAGLLAQAMAGFVAWLAGRHDAVGAEARKLGNEYRDAAASNDGHRRTAEIVAQLTLGWEFFARYAVEVGVVSQDEADKRLQLVRKTLREAATAQIAHHAAAEPATQFLELLRTALTTGHAHVASREGKAPRGGYAQALGWRPYECGEGEYRFEPKGQRIGWVDGDELLLDPGAAYKAAQEIARASGKTLPINEKTLHKRLNEKLILKTTDLQRGTLTVRTTAEGSRRPVLHLGVSTLGVGVAVAVNDEQDGTVQHEGAAQLELGVGGEVSAEQMKRRAGEGAAPVETPF